MLNNADSNAPHSFSWNDTLDGHYLWSNVNFGEAVTEVMTPLTWSVIQFTLDDWVFMPGYPTVGVIGGYPYLNISVFATLFNRMGRSRVDLLKYMEGTLYMRLPDEIEIPLIHLSGKKLVGTFLAAARVQWKQVKGLRRLPAYLAGNQNFVQVMREQIANETDRETLYNLWHEEIKPHIKRGVWCVLGSVSHASDYTLQLRRDLTQLVGPDDANLLIGNMGASEGPLASLEPMLGLGKLARGEWTQAAYIERFGHRGPGEFELSIPRPAENPTWIDQQVSNFRDSSVDVMALVRKQQAAFDGALDRLRSRHPQQAVAFLRRIQESACRGRRRESARSAYVRDRWLIRLFALRVGELCGCGDEIFFLTLEEVMGLLKGDNHPTKCIPTRRETYQQFKSLPPYPSIILGRFDPHQWVADPQRRNDIFSSQPLKNQGDTCVIEGSPGSAGQVEGTVRCLENPEEGRHFQQGEILVAVQTDIAWTMIFPRAAAVITDVGAPLSHAAIVARELGIPAVVGCGDATARLKTGDRVQVDGGRGIVTILHTEPD